MMSLDDKVTDDKVTDDKVTDDKVADDKVADDKQADDKQADDKVEGNLTNETLSNEAIENSEAVDESIENEVVILEEITNDVVDKPVEDKGETTEKVEEAINEEVNEEDNAEDKEDKSMEEECEIKSGKDDEKDDKKNPETKKRPVREQRSKGNRGRKPNTRQRRYRNFKPQSGKIKRGEKRPRSRRGRFSDAKPKARDIEPWLNPPGQITGNSWEYQPFIPLVQNSSYSNSRDPNVLMYNCQLSCSFPPDSSMGNFNCKRVGLLGDSPYDPQPSYGGFNSESDAFSHNEDLWNAGSGSSGMNYRRPYPNRNSRNRQENSRKRSWTGRKNKRWNKSKRRDQGGKRRA